MFPTSTEIKLGQLRLCFRDQVRDFLDRLKTAGIRYIIGEALRSEQREWELWVSGRQCGDESRKGDPFAWVVVNKKGVKTNVPPGSGKGPHPFGLAIDIYPADENGQIMRDDHPLFISTMKKMHTLAEACGIDALGSNNKAHKACDQYASWDPSHYQFCGWFLLVEKERQIRQAAASQA